MSEDRRRPRTHDPVVERMLAGVPHTPWPLFPRRPGDAELPELLGFLARLTGARRIAVLGAPAADWPAADWPPVGATVVTFVTEPPDGDGQRLDMAVVGPAAKDRVACWDRLVPHLREGGLLAVTDLTDPADVAGAFFAHVRADDRVDAVRLPPPTALVLGRRR
ncbi:hypothetical protein ACFOOM_00165 [Streptomyces echinoruber]|uniref:Uncharacterized protein n=1 Tax=Streptomyces echinoruber TaxID=68898 RepID=A0A918QYF5_9ACTN|nr:hypothetical protein [Streptomyces echinoruber]GGZ74423.1 hypothetical protein GCM10010389_10130 [Streptomyces echinoruber]